MKIIIRADSSTVIGGGHIMRCLALAEELHSQVIFACRELPGNISAIIEKKGYRCKMLPEELEKANIEFLGFLKQHNADILIIDNYDTGIELESKARNFVEHIVVIDDLADKQHECDLLLNQNPVADIHKNYDKFLPKKSIKLLGLPYTILRKEFVQLPTINAKPEGIKNILIFFGSGDHHDMTSKILDAIISNKLAISEQIHFDVVAGIANPNKDKIRHICGTQKNYTYHCQVDNMAELMRNADLYIGAGGTTNWERMCIGLPGIIISIAANQEDICRNLDEMELIKYLGSAEDFSAGRFIYTLKWVEENPLWQQKSITKGKELVDGAGTKRVAANIKSLLIKLRKATDDDCNDLYNWRYDKINLRYSFNKEKVPYDQHKEWFHKTINSENNDLLIASIKEQPIGVIRFDYEKDNTAEISLYLVPGQHGKSYGLQVLTAAEHWLGNNRPKIKSIHAKVLKDNAASTKIFSCAMYGRKQGKYITYY